MPEARTRPARSTPGQPARANRARVWTALAIGVVAAAYAATFSLAIVNDTSNPALARTLYGGLPASAERLADLAIGNSAQRALQAQGTAVRPGALPPSLISGIGLTLPQTDQRRIGALALDGLAATPLASGALRQLAYIEPDQSRRVQLLSLAQDVTRRDVLANLQLAELQLRRGSVEEGLAALDQTLVISRNVDGAVFPILLTAAEASRTAATQVGTLLRDDPIWAERLVGWSVDNPRFLPALSLVVGNLPSTSPARASGYGQQMVDLLIGQNRFAEAFRAYRAFAGRAAGLATLTGGAYPPLDWKLVDNYDSGSRVFDDGVIEVFANPGRQGGVAQVFAQLPPGQRALSFRITETVGAGAQLSLTVTCLADGREQIVTEQNTQLRNGTTTFAFAVPAGACPFQRLDLGVAAGNETSSALLRLASQPASGRTPARTT